MAAVMERARGRQVERTTDEAESTADLVRVYLDGISATPLLSAEEEVALSERIEAGVYAEHLLADLAKASADTELADGGSGAVTLDSTLDDATEVPLPSGRTASVRDVRAVAVDGERARQHFLAANLRLVVSVARKYPRSQMSLLDLIQEGNLGLIRAVEKFDYRRGFKFSTYATWWIRQSISRAIAQSGRTIRLPVHLGEEVGRMTRAKRDLTRELGRDPNDAEVANAIGVEVARVVELTRLAKDPVSLNSPVGEDEESALEDFVRDAAIPGPEDIVIASYANNDLHRLVERLDERSAAVVRARYGMDDGETHTFAEIGTRLGLSRARIQQIEREAIGQLRRLAAESGVDAA